MHTLNYVSFKIIIFLYLCGLIVLRGYFNIHHLGDELRGSVVNNGIPISFDFIIVGAGSAGSVVARRLTDDGYSVLLLEAGGSPSYFMDVPALAPTLQMTRFDWGYQTVPQAHACYALKNRSSRWPRGKVLGGSSRLHLMVYLRGDPRDFDAWEEMGNPGWSYQSVLPFFKLSENQQGIYKYDGKNHGVRGPLSVADATWNSKLANIFIEAGKFMGYDVGDLNGFFNSGFMLTQHMTRDGARLSGDSAYLTESRNLHILTHAFVQRILFRSGNIAHGVEFLHYGQRTVAIALKEVILSAGAIGSPQILMLSGLGPASHLQEFNIPVTADLQGVGRNLQDHILTGTDLITFETGYSDLPLSISTFSNPRAYWDYLFSGTGPLTFSGCEALAFVHSALADKSSPPDLQLMFMPVGYSMDCGQILRHASCIADSVWEKYFEPLCGKSVASILLVLLRPKSRGSLYLRSTNPSDHPYIDPQYFSDDSDVKTMVQGMHLVQRLIESAPFSEAGARLNRSPFPGCEGLQFGSDDYWACYVRHLSLSSYHPVGTCRMGPAHREDSVVDHQLKVHGVSRLRVIDASVMPTIVGANVNAATVMIAEKGAHMIRAFWRHQNSVCHITHVFLDCFSCLA